AHATYNHDSWHSAGMRKVSAAALVALSVLALAPSPAPADDVPAWTITLRPADFVIGPALAQLHTRRTWAAGFDEQPGGFEIALRKKAITIPAPSCNMDFLILKIPSYYPENPKQASVGERRAIFDSFTAFQ